MGSRVYQFKCVLMESQVSVANLRKYRLRWSRSWREVVAIGALLVIVSVFTVSPDRGPLTVCEVKATHDIAAMCYRTQIVVNKSTAGDLTNHPIEIRTAGAEFVDQRLTNAHAWDLQATDVARSAIPLIAQDIATSSPALTSWWIMGDLTGSASTTFQLYSGHQSHQRNQGIYFSTACHTLSEPCGDMVEVPDTTDHQLTDNLDLIVMLATSTAPDQDGWFISKFSTSTTAGYRLGVSSSSTGMFVAQVGNGTASTTLYTAWDGSAQTVRFRFDAGATNDMTIAFEAATSSPGTFIEVAATDAAYASLATTSVALNIGESYEGEIYEAEVRDNVGAGSYGKVSQWSFNAEDMGETQRGTSANGYRYEGTVNDVIGSRQGVYVFIRDQTSIVSSVAPTAFSYAAAGAAEVVDTPVDVLGSIGSGDFATTSAALWANLGMFGDALSLARGGSSLGSVAFFYMMILFVASGVGIGAWMLSDGNETIMSGMMIAVFGIGAAIGMIPPWWGVISGLTIATGWLLLARARGGAVA